MSAVKLRYTDMVWLLASSLLTVIVAVISFETNQNIWDNKNVYDRRHLPDTTDLNVSVASPIECVLTALTYNRSMATYDWLSQQCVIHDTMNHTAMTSEMDVLYVIKGDIKTCGDLDPASLSGVYRITPVQNNSFDVYCDMDSEGGPWTVIQNRQSNEVDFYRNWDQYKTGFGDLLGNFWLGNDHIFVLTRTPCVMRIQLESLNGTFGYAEYSEFHIANEKESYQLSVGGFSGNISNGFRTSDDQFFTTLDRDNDFDDVNICAEKRRAGWWFRRCTSANLNGIYEYDPSNYKYSMYWRDFFGQDMFVPMKTSRMMLKHP